MASEIASTIFEYVLLGMLIWILAEIVMFFMSFKGKGKKDPYSTVTGPTGKKNPNRNISRIVHNNNKILEKLNDLKSQLSGVLDKNCKIEVEHDTRLEITDEDFRKVKDSNHQIKNLVTENSGILTILAQRFEEFEVTPEHETALSDAAVNFSNALRNYNTIKSRFIEAIRNNKTWDGGGYHS